MFMSFKNKVKRKSRIVQEKLNRLITSEIRSKLQELMNKIKQFKKTFRQELDSGCEALVLGICETHDKIFEALKKVKETIVSALSKNRPQYRRPNDRP